MVLENEHVEQCRKLEEDGQSKWKQVRYRYGNCDDGSCQAKLRTQERRKDVNDAIYYFGDIRPNMSKGPICRREALFGFPLFR